MNLVSKEYVVCRKENTGVLILSEFCGAASELGEALSVNPHDIDSMAMAIKEALSMSTEEQQRRMTPMRDRVIRHHVGVWVDSFVSALKESSSEDLPEVGPLPLYEERRKIVALARGRPLVLLLDYDGTLVELKSRPEDATPSSRLKSLLRRLADRPDTSVFIVSGRNRECLQDFLGDLPLCLCAEHCYWMQDNRTGGSGEVKEMVGISGDWKSRVRNILDEFTKRVPKSRVEEKDVSLVWHYRNCDEIFGALQAQELRMLLLQSLSHMPLEVIQFQKAVAIRPQGVNKGLVVRDAVLAENPKDTVYIAIGDDRTDQDMFEALQGAGVSHAYSIRVGTRHKQQDDHVGPRDFATHIVNSVQKVHEFLQYFVE